MLPEGGSLPPSPLSSSEPLADPWLDQVGADTKTTPMSPWTMQDDPCASLDAQGQPHVGLQCQCQGSITKIAEDIAELHKQLVDTVVVPDVYNDNPDSVGTDIASCDPRNQALVWLSSGDTRQGGNMEQRYALATLFFATESNNATSTTTDSAATAARRTLRRRLQDPPTSPPLPEPTSTATGENWREQWLSDGNECEWPGVQCAENKQVTGLILDDLELAGEVRYHAFNSSCVY